MADDDIESLLEYIDWLEKKFILSRACFLGMNPDLVRKRGAIKLGTEEFTAYMSKMEEEARRELERDAKQAQPSKEFLNLQSMVELFTEFCYQNHKLICNDCPLLKICNHGYEVHPDEKRYGKIPS